MNSTMRLLVIALLAFTGCRSTDMFSVFKSESPSERLAESSTSSPKFATKDPVVTELSQSAASIPAATAEQVKQGQLLVAAWYRDAKPDTLAQARQHFEAALRQQPRNVDALHGVGIVADLQKQYVVAEKHYLLALAEEPSNSKVLGDLGYSYLLQKRLQESEQYLNRALAHDPNNQNAVKHLGDVYAQNGKVDLARETYRRVLNGAEIEAALAENAASAPADNRSLFDRLRDKPSADQQMVDNIRQRMDANRENAQQRNGVQQVAGGSPPPYPGGRPLQGEALRDQLNNIDRERYANVSRGPIILGGPGETPQQIPHADYQNNGWANQGQASSLDGMSVDLARPSAMAAGSNGGWDSQSNIPYANGNLNGNGNQPPGINANQYANQAPAQGQFAGSPMPPANASGSDIARLTQPWGQPVTQAGAQMSPGQSPQTMAGVDSAYYQQQQGFNPNSPYMQPNAGQAGGTLPQAGQASAQNAQVQSAADPLQEASKAAARMGMGFGPGAMFPVFAQSATQTMPGSSTMHNGAAVPQPQRYLPTDSAPVDLRQQMNVQMPESRMVTNQFGQQVPMAATNSTSPHQLGTASRYTPGNVQSQPMDSYQNLQMYDNQRNQAANDLNSAIQQTGGRQMQAAPQGVQGVNYPGGSVMYSPQGGSQYTAPNQQQTSPPEYPYNGRPANSNAPAPGMSAQPQNAPSQYPRDVVIPESYNNRDGRRPAGTGTSQQPAAGPSQPASNWDGGLPQIVPGR